MCAIRLSQFSGKIAHQHQRPVIIISASVAESKKKRFKSEFLMLEDVCLEHGIDRKEILGIKTAIGGSFKQEVISLLVIFLTMIPGNIFLKFCRIARQFILCAVILIEIESRHGILPFIPQPAIAFQCLVVFLEMQIQFGYVFLYVILSLFLFLLHIDSITSSQCLVIGFQ